MTVTAAIASSQGNASYTLSVHHADSTVTTLHAVADLDNARACLSQAHGVPIEKVQLYSAKYDGYDAIPPCYELCDAKRATDILLDGELHVVFGANNGEVVWEVPLCTEVEKAELYGLWKCDSDVFKAIHNVVNAPITLDANDTVAYIVGIYGKCTGVHAMDLNRGGALRWFYAVEMEEWGTSVQLSANEDTGVLCSIIEGLQVHAVDTSNGKARWVRALPFRFDCDVPLKLVHNDSGEEQCIVQGHHQYAALDMSTGDTLWTHHGADACIVWWGHDALVSCSAPYAPSCKAHTLQVHSVRYDDGACTTLLDVDRLSSLETSDEDEAYPAVYRVYSVCYVARGAVVLVYTHDVIHAYRGNALMWTLTTGNTDDQPVQLFYTSRPSTPETMVTVAHDTRVLLMRQGKLCCLDIATGGTCWAIGDEEEVRITETTKLHVASDKRRVYVTQELYIGSDEPTYIDAIDVGTGHVLAHISLSSKQDNAKRGNIEQLHIYPEHALAIVLTENANTLHAVHLTKHTAAGAPAGNVLWSHQLGTGKKHPVCALASDGTGLVVTGWDNCVRLLHC